jgi:hypothetical protein
LVTFVCSDKPSFKTFIVVFTIVCNKLECLSLVKLFLAPLANKLERFLLGNSFPSCLGWVGWGVYRIFGYFNLFSLTLCIELQPYFKTLIVVFTIVCNKLECLSLVKLFLPHCHPWQIS